MTHTLALIRRYHDSEAICTALGNASAVQEHAAQAAFWTSLWREQGGTLRAVEDLDTFPCDSEPS